ncbi:MAG: 1-acyl-sn-glycerol-3-phosphate acyltransferase [Spirochaetales bacterium]|nr:1-acyl-sn-glycerol-3-phosphate acyltransferase [Spirochaetales bacterium]
MFHRRVDIWRIKGYYPDYMVFFTKAAQISRILRTPIQGFAPIALFLIRVVVCAASLLVTVKTAARREALPSPAVFAVNHSAEYDAFLVPCFLIAFGGRSISFFIHWMFRNFPLVGWLMKQIDPIWVENRETKKQWLKKYKRRKRGNPIAEAIKKISTGTSVGIFPEGGLNRNPEKLTRGRLGIGEIVLKTGLPVIPVGVDFPVRRRFGKIPVFGRLIISIGLPLRFPLQQKQWQKLSADAHPEPRILRLQQNDLCQEISHTVMRAIAPLCGKKYPF